jgi:hypothetical protein
MAIVWRESAARFADSDSGSFVSEARVRALVDAVADQTSATMAAASERLLAGELSLGAWQAQMQAAIRTSHVAVAVLANGGAAQMTNVQWLVTARDVKAQYAYLRQFAADVASGRQPLNRTIVSRSAMYGQHVRVLYEQIRSDAAIGLGVTQSRNVLHAQESCSDCRALTARGWMPAAEMTPIGSRRCLSMCRCVILRRRRPVGDEAAA